MKDFLVAYLEEFHHEADIKISYVKSLSESLGLKGWGGRWGRFRMEGTHIYLWPICTDVWQNKKKSHNHTIVNSPSLII